MTKKKILFLGTHGQYNIGDELLLETFLSQLGREHSYMINSYDPSYTCKQLAERYDVDVFHTTNDKLQLPQRIWQSDLLFFGGGSVIKELYASVGRNRYATLMMILVIVSFANLVARKPIIMSNIGVGPIRSRFGLFLAKLILMQATFVSVRDQRSYDTCQKLGISREKVMLVPDAVFANEARNIALNSDSAQVEGPLKIALNLNYNIANPDNWNLFLSNLAAALNAVGARHELEIHALPMQTQFNPDNDLRVLQSFRAQIPDLNVIMHEPETAADVAQILSGCDLVVAERLHALVLASILQKPFVALMYDVKVQELTSFLDMEQLAIDINRPFDASDLARNILEALEQRPTIVANLSTRVSLAAEQLGSYFARVNEQYVMPVKHATH